MKITVERASTLETQSLKPTLNSPPSLDLSQKRIPLRNSQRRKIKTSGVGVLLRREVGSPSGKRISRPETPFLRWKFDEDDGNSKEKSSTKRGRRVRTVLSARKLAAGLWRINLPEFQTNGGQTLGLQCGADHGGFFKHGHYKTHRAPGKDLVHSPCSVVSLRKKCEPSFQFPNVAMEGITKWDPAGRKMLDGSMQMFGESKHLIHQQRASTGPVITALQTELQQARARISELEMERRSSKKKLEQFLQKLSEERAAWRRKEHEKIRAIIDDVKADLNREKKNRQKLEMINSKLVNQLSDTKLLAKRYRQECEKERAEREMVEEVCDELAKEIGDDRDEVEAVKRESIKLQHEVEVERKMLQMAEVWREERVQMKLVDAKVMLEEKYSQMNKLVATLQAFLDSRSSISDAEELKKAEFIWQAATSVNIQDIRELTYEPPNSDDILSVFEDVNFGESNEEAEGCVGYSPASHTSKIHTVSPKVKMLVKDGAHVLSNVYMGQSGELEEDTSEWETVSHAEDQDSSYSPDGSDPSFSKNYRLSNVSRNGTELDRSGEGTPIIKISEVGPKPARNSKKVPSISRLWKSYPNNEVNFKNLSDEGEEGRLSNEVDMSPDHVSGKNELIPHHLPGHWSSSDKGNPQATRGPKGCIEWPRSVQKSSLKARLLEARMETQKIQLRQVLKQKI